MAQRTRGQGRKPVPRSRRPGSLADLMRAIAAEPVEVTADADGEEVPPAASSRQEQLVRALWARAMDGDLAAARLLIEDMEDKVSRGGQGMQGLETVWLKLRSAWRASRGWKPPG